MDTDNTVVKTSEDKCAEEGFNEGGKGCVWKQLKSKGYICNAFNNEDTFFFFKWLIPITKSSKCKEVLKTLYVE